MAFPYEHGERVKEECAWRLSYYINYYIANASLLIGPLLLISRHSTHSFLFFSKRKKCKRARQRSQRSTTLRKFKTAAEHSPTASISFYLAELGNILHKTRASDRFDLLVLCALHHT